jgi:ABC-type multidrug transport system ATPase subunit
VQDQLASQSVFYNQKALYQMALNDIQTMIAFVAQHDAPYYGLTAREILMYQAMLTVSLVN